MDMGEMLEARKRAFPITIPGVLPFRNVLKGFEMYGSHFAELYTKVASHKGMRIHIIQVGAGGTGGFVAAEIMRYISNLPQAIQKFIFYTLVDGDKFEEKNISRQLCTENEIGEFKAQSLVDRCIEQYGCLASNTKAINEYITSPTQFYDMMFGLPTPVLQVHDFKFDIKKGFDLYDKGNQPIVAIEGLDHHTPINYFPNVNKIVQNVPLDRSYTVYRYNQGYVRHDFYRTFEKFFNNTEERYDLYRDDDGTVIPIVIDCVDKTTVRNIIKQVFKGLNYSLPLNDHISLRFLKFVNNQFEESKRDITAFDKFHMFFPGGNAVFPVNEEDPWLLQDSYVYAPKLNPVTRANITKFKDCLINDLGLPKVKELYKYSIPTSFWQNPYLVGVRDALRTVSWMGNETMYLISSGNGEFTGQVAWGRSGNYLNGTKPLSIDEIWKNPDDAIGPLASKEDKDSCSSDMYTTMYYSDNAFNGMAKDSDLYKNIKEKFIDSTYNGRVSSGSISVNFNKDENRYYIKFPDNIAIDLLKANYAYLMHMDWSSSYLSCVDVEPKEYMHIKTNAWGKKKRFMRTSNYNNIPRRFIDNVYHNNIVQDEKDNIIKDIRYTIGCGFQNEFPVYVRSSDGGFILPEEVWPNFSTYVARYLSVPLPYDLYPGMVDLNVDKQEEQLSCADRAVQNLQSINANKTAANLVFNYFSTIMNGLLGLKSEGCREITLDNISTYFDTRDNTYYSTKITTDLLYEHADSFKYTDDQELFEYLYKEAMTGHKSDFTLEDVQENANDNKEEEK